MITISSPSYWHIKNFSWWSFLHCLHVEWVVISWHWSRNWTDASAKVVYSFTPWPQLYKITVQRIVHTRYGCSFHFWLWTKYHFWYQPYLVEKSILSLHSVVNLIITSHNYLSRCNLSPSQLYTRSPTSGPLALVPRWNTYNTTSLWHAAWQYHIRTLNILLTRLKFLVIHNNIHYLLKLTLWLSSVRSLGFNDGRSRYNIARQLQTLEKLCSLLTNSQNLRMKRSLFWPWFKHRPLKEKLIKQYCSSFPCSIPLMSLYY